MRQARDEASERACSTAARRKRVLIITTYEVSPTNWPQLTVVISFGPFCYTTPYLQHGLLARHLLCLGDGGVSCDRHQVDAVSVASQVWEVVS